MGGIGLGADLGRGAGQQGLDLVVGPRGLAQDDRGRAGDDRACLIGAAASYVPRSLRSQRRIWTFTLDLPVGIRRTMQLCLY